MPPFGRRQASAIVRRPRIITPSITACPPYRGAVSAPADPQLILLSPSAARHHARRHLAGGSGLRGRRVGRLLRVPLGEALDASLHVEDVLRAGIEGMAAGADLDVELWLRRARHVAPTAGADDLRLHVFGMDLLLHACRAGAVASRSAPRPLRVRGPPPPGTSAPRPPTSAVATTFTRLRSSRAGRNWTVPATSANRV